MIKKLSKQLLTVLLSLIICGFSYGQSEAIFERIVSKNEEFQSYIYCVAQDSFGNIWAGTEEGVVRFDSREAFLYNKYRGLSNKLTNQISAIFIDSRERIWIGNQQGVSCYNPLKDVFEFIEQQKGLGPTLVESIMEDEQGQIWIGGFNGVWKYIAAEENPVSSFLRFANDLQVRTLTMNKGQLLIGANQGLYQLDISGAGTLSPLLFTAPAEHKNINAIFINNEDVLLGTKEQGLFKTNLSFSKVESIVIPPFGSRYFQVKDIIADENKNIYLATDGAGLLHLDQQYQMLSTFMNDPNNVESISSNGIYDIMLDKENLLWIGTYGGGLNLLNLSDENFKSITHRLNDDNSISHNFTRSILEDEQGNIWFGSKEGISVWNRKNNLWKQLPSLGRKSATGDIVLALAEEGDYIWACTYGRGAFKINKENFSTTHYSDVASADVRIALSKIYAVLIDSKGNCWLGGIEEDLHRIAPSGEISTFPISQIRQIIERKDGSILTVGRSGAQLIKEDKIAVIEALRSGNNGVEYTTISCVREDESGSLLLGTNGGGLIFYDVESNKISSMNRSSGLPSDVVHAVLEENKKSLWVSTTRGLANVQLFGGDTIVKVFNKADGLVSSEFNYGSAGQLADKTLLFGGVDGVVYFQPSKIFNQSEVPNIVFTDLFLFNKKVEIGEEALHDNINFTNHIKLRHNENALSLKFIGVLHSASGNVKYQWRMDGLNKNWSEASNENQINFTNLSPGDYTFNVRAANRDGIWGAIRSLDISIASPWWATSWAYLLYAVLGIGTLLGTIYLGGVFINKRNAEEQIAFFSNITHELKTPLSILLSTLETAPKLDGNTEETNKKIKTTITRLNTLFDQLLNFHKVTSDDKLIKEIAKLPLHSHLQKVVNNFKPLLEKRNLTLRIDDRWKKDFFFYDKDIFDKIIFNLISNAIKYSKENGEISVILQSDTKEGLKLSVVDDGIGIPKDQQKFILKRYYRGRNAINSQMPGTGLGLMIVKSLVERDKGTIEFHSEENEGTTFTVYLKNQQEYFKGIPTTTISEPEESPTEDIKDNTKILEFSDAKILIVEDNDELRQILLDRIGMYFQVHEASNGREGLEMVTQIFPDLILTDMIMPEMDGMAMSQALQEDINMNHIPIFMMTVLNNTAHKIESIETGITAYMEKPIDFDFLLAKMVSTLAWKKKLREKYLHEIDVNNADKFRNERDADFINSLEDFVLQQVKEEGLSVQDLCRHVGMSRTALYMKLKDLVDLSPQNFIIHTRLKYARKLLMESEINVKEVAYMAGFANPKYFSTSFKKLFGDSPTGFKKSLKA